MYTTRLKACGHLTMTLMCLLYVSWFPLYYYNSLHSSRETFHYILQCDCRDLFSFSYKSINKVRH